MEDFASSAFYSILFIYLFICLFVVRSVSSMHLFAPFDLPQHLAMFFFSNLTWLLQEQKYLCTQIIAPSVECRFLNKQRSNINLIKVGI